MAQPLLLDTNILLAYVRNGPLKDRIEANYGLESEDNLTCISIVTEGELRSLALQLGWGRGRTERMEQVLARSARIPLEAPGIP